MKIVKRSVAIALLTALMVVEGHGSDTPAGVVGKYIDAWNHADIPTIRHLVDNDTAKSIDHMVYECLSDYLLGVVERQRKVYLREVRDAWRKYNPMLFKPKDTSNKNILTDGLQAIHDDTTLSEAERIEKSALFILGHTKENDQVKAMMHPLPYRFYAFMFFNKQLGYNGLMRYDRDEYFDTLILEEILENKDPRTQKVQKRCHQEYFKPGFIDHYTIIQTIDGEYEDKKRVRVELIDKKGGSRKKEITVERINQEWRATNTL